MDAKVLEITIKAHLKEMSSRLDEAAASPRPPKPALRQATFRRRSRSRSTLNISSMRRTHSSMPRA